MVLWLAARVAFVFCLDLGKGIGKLRKQSPKGGLLWKRHCRPLQWQCASYWYCRWEARLVSARAQPFKGSCPAALAPYPKWSRSLDCAARNPRCSRAQGAPAIERLYIKTNLPREVRYIFVFGKAIEVLAQPIFVRGLPLLWKRHCRWPAHLAPTPLNSNCVSIIPILDKMQTHFILPESLIL